MKRIPSDLVPEFEAFKTAPLRAPPAPLTGRLLARVFERPSPWTVVLSKLAVITLFAGLLNLVLCPQFGIGFMRNSGLHEFFMTFGVYGCKAACGAFFIGSALFISTFVLQDRDIESIRMNPLLQVSALSALSLVSFVALGGAIFFDAALVWFAGSVIGGVVSFEASYLISMHLRARKTA